MGPRVHHRRHWRGKAVVGADAGQRRTAQTSTVERPDVAASWGQPWSAGEAATTLGSAEGPTASTTSEAGITSPEARRTPDTVPPETPVARISETGASALMRAPLSSNRDLHRSKSKDG